MPIYEYRCNDCQYQFDKLQKMSDAPLKTCPQCQHDTLTKLVSAAGFQLKGTGWYVTDFRDGDKKPMTKAGTSDGEHSGGSTTASTDGDQGGTTTTTSSNGDSKTETKKEKESA